MDIIGVRIGSLVTFAFCNWNPEVAATFITQTHRITADDATRGLRVISIATLLLPLLLSAGDSDRSGVAFQLFIVRCIMKHLMRNPAWGIVNMIRCR